MSEQKHYPRPRQVTVAAFTGIAGGVLLVLSLFDSVGSLRSVEMRNAVEEFLAEPPGNGLGASVAEVLDWLHVLLLVNGALAAVATVLAVYLLWGHRVARVGFTVVSAVLLFTGAFTGGVLAILLAFAATMLWSRPAREWFAGRDPDLATPARSGPPPRMQAFERPGQVQRAPSTAHRWPPPSTTSTTGSGEAEPAGESPHRPPPSPRRFGDPADLGWGQPQAAPPHAAPAGTDARPPGQVVVAAVITFVFSGLVLTVFSVVVALLMGSQETLISTAQSDPALGVYELSTADLLAALWLVSAVAIVWSLGAVALGVLVLRRVNGARAALAVSCAMSVFCSVFLQLYGIPLVVAAGAVFGLLFSRPAARWFAGRPRASQQPPHGGPPAPPSGPGSSSGPEAGPPAPEPARQPVGKPPVW